MTRQRYLISFVALALILMGTAIMVGGIHAYALGLTLILLFPLLYFAWTIRQRSWSQILKQPFFILGLGFWFWAAVTAYWSLNLYQTLEGLVWWLAAGLIALAAVTLINDEHRLRHLTTLLVSVGSLLSILGIIIYLFDPGANARLESTFFQHNAYAGFLLLLLPLAGYFFLTARHRFILIWSGAAVALMLSNFVLTFSRGAWLSLVSGLAVLGLMTWFNPRHPPKKNFLTTKIILLLLISALAAFGLYYLKHQPAADSKSALPPFQIFAGETSDENAFTARLHYWHTAVAIIKHLPLTGTGLEAYRSAEQTYRDAPQFSTDDPHNLYLRLVAETGLVGGLLIIAWFLLIFLKLIATLRRPAAGNHLFTAISLGLLMVMIHNGMEVDWHFPAHLIIFWALAAITVSWPNTEAAQSPASASTPIGRSSWLDRSALIIAALLCPVGIWSVLAYNHWQDGEFFAGKNKIPEAIAAYQQSLRLNPFNYNAHYDLANVDYFAKNYTSARVAIEQAITWNRANTSNYTSAADIYEALGQPTKQEQALITALQYNRINSIGLYNKLATLYYQQQKYNKIIPLTNYVVTKYPLALWSDPFWGHPAKAQMRIEIGITHALRAAADEKLGQTSQAIAERAQVELFAPGTDLNQLLK